MDTRSRTIIRVFFVAILLAVFYQLGWLSPAERALNALFSPISKQLYAAGQGAQHGEVLSYEELQKNYEDLTEQYHARAVELSEFARLKEEHAALRSLLGFASSTGYAVLGADVVGRSIDPLGSLLIVNRGERQGVEIGDPVIAENGSLVGIVSAVHERSADVRRIDDNQSRIAATVQSQDKSIGIVEGQHGISIEMNFIPQNELVSVGDVVITSGLQEGIPRGMTIGAVVSVEKEPFEPFQRAQIRPLTQIDKLFVVGILTDV